MKAYADEKRRAQPITIKEGDKVLLKRQIKANKMATTFEPDVYRVIKRKGSELTVENLETLTQYRRNVSHVKKTFDQDDDVNLDFLPATTGPSQQPAAPEQPKQKTCKKRGGNKGTSDTGVTDNLPSKRKRGAPTRYGM